MPPGKETFPLNFFICLFVFLIYGSFALIPLFQPRQRSRSPHQQGS